MSAFAAELRFELPSIAGEAVVKIGARRPYALAFGLGTMLCLGASAVHAQLATSATQAAWTRQPDAPSADVGPSNTDTSFVAGRIGPLASADVLGISPIEISDAATIAMRGRSTRGRRARRGAVIGGLIGLGVATWAVAALAEGTAPWYRDRGSIDALVSFTAVGALVGAGIGAMLPVNE